MDMLVTALAPAFAAGFALQQLLEILDPIIDKIAKDWKKLFLALVSLAFGLILAFAAGIRVLVHFGYAGVDLWDAIITALIVSAGTEGINSIMKYLGYAKDNKKQEEAKGAASTAALPPAKKKK